ncbi:hypothetical protein DOE76_07725 [Leifsonia sp. ku-ls]|nr:hypothetical protein DOE76_07725 [Leifsonia sp. ku-ls]
MLLQSGMEFDKLPSAYESALALANVAAADATWRPLSDHIEKSQQSFAKVRSGTGSDEEFERFQRDLALLDKDCTAVGKPLTDR